MPVTKVSGPVCDTSRTFPLISGVLPVVSAPISPLPVEVSRNITTLLGKVTSAPLCILISGIRTYREDIILTPALLQGLILRIGMMVFPVPIITSSITNTLIKSSSSALLPQLSPIKEYLYFFLFLDHSFISFGSFLLLPCLLVFSRSLLVLADFSQTFLTPRLHAGSSCPTGQAFSPPSPACPSPPVSPPETVLVLESMIY